MMKPQRSVLSAVLVAALAAPAPGHGGVYRGPGSAIGPGGATAGGPSTGGAGLKNTDVAAWDQWWSFNRDRYLALKDAVFTGEGPRTAGFEDYFLGKGAIGRPGGGLRPSEKTLREEVVPALEELLEGQQDVDIITGVLLALAKIGDGPGGPPRFGALLRSYLTHGNQEVHETAAVALGVLAEPDAAPLLADLAMDTPAGRRACGRERVPQRTRAFATYGLGLVGYRADAEAVRRFVVHHLAQVILLGDKPTRDVGVAAVISSGLVRLPIAETPPASDAPARPSASRQGQIEFLLTVWADHRRDARLRAHLPVALARLAEGVGGNTKARLVDAFRRAIDPRSSESPVVRHGALMGSALLGDNDQDPEDVRLRATLTEATRSGDRLGRNLALLSLARTAGREGSGEIGEAPAEVRKLLLGRLARGDTVERPWAAIALALGERSGVASGHARVDAVRAALHDAYKRAGNPSQQGALAIALGVIGHRVAAPDLIPRTTSGDENARGYAAVALGLMRAENAVPTLRGIVARTSYKPGVLREAAIALALLGDKTAAPILIERLRASARMFEQIALASALGFIGDGRTVDPLVAILRNERLSETTQAFAAVALGMICDKETYPWNSKIAVDVLWWQAPTTLHDSLSGKGILDIL